MMHRIGAGLYLLWGLVHIGAAYETWRLAEGLGAGPAQGRIFQDAWYLLAFAVSAILVAVFLNWRNSRTGYWINLALVSVADVGFIAFVLAPGHLPVLPGLIGPALWLLAAGFSTAGYLRPPR